MQIEVGKYYKTRDGRKAFIAAKLPNPSDEPYIGYAEYTHGQIVESWYEDGSYITDQSSGNDLIEEWKEPKSGVRYVNIYDNPDARSYIYLTRKEADNAAPNDRIARIRVEWKEGQFDD